MSAMNTTDEVLEVISQVLIRCVVMGVVVLLFWWGALELMGDFVYRAHARIAPMTREQFALIHYVGLLSMKATVSILFFFPFVAIRLVLKKRAKGLSSS